tara:strand:+ start:80 stop:1069 length:990 start_codon:yes stop_codon:yes gene_type:complete
MCDPITVGIGTAVVGLIGTVAQFSQQQAQTQAANDQAFAQFQAQSRAAEQAAMQQQQQALFELQNYNNQVELQNQQTLNSWINTTQQTMQSNLRLQTEFLTAQQQRDYTNLNNQLQFQQNLNQSILSQERSDTQLELNQEGLAAKLESNQRRQNDAEAMRAFEAERLLASSIKSQGSVLAQGQTGQSIGLASNDVIGSFGRDMRMLQRNRESSLADFRTENTNAFLTKAQKDAEAIASIMPKPMQPLDLPNIAPPVFGDAPADPIFAKFSMDPGPTSGPVYGAIPTAISGPSPIGLVAGIGGAALGGYQSYLGAKSLIKTPQELAGKGN